MVRRQSNQKWDTPTLVIVTYRRPVAAAHGELTRRHAGNPPHLKLAAAPSARASSGMLLCACATHKHPQVKAWLARNPRITLHFTPTSGSWLNMVEIFVGIITRQAIRRGTYRSVKDLITAIGNFIDGWNDRCQPFVWIKTADELLPHCQPGKRASFTRH